MDEISIMLYRRSKENVSIVIEIILHTDAAILGILDLRTFAVELQGLVIGKLHIIGATAGVEFVVETELLLHPKPSTSSEKEIAIEAFIVILKKVRTRYE